MHSCQALTHALYYLAAYPQYADPIREEVQAIMDSNSEALSREALAKMHKLDSFLKESQRLSMGACKSDILSTSLLE